MKVMLTAGALLALTACMTNGQDEVPAAAPAEDCDASKVSDLVGRPATSELGAEVQRRTGARTFRWLQPGQIVTMEYRGDRVSVHLDERNNVRSINCG